MPAVQELLAHQEFVHRLARHLVGDEHRADDIVQDVWMAALERPPHGLRSVRAWLTRVTRNLATNEARSVRNRRAREERAVPESSVAATAEREFELTHRVAAAVHALDEPYRATMLLRYFKDLPRARIAEATGVSVATVSTRLQRGLAKLKERLDREHGGDRAAWTHGLVLFLGNGITPSAGTTGGGLLTGGLAMGMTVKVVVGIAVAVCAVWLAWSPEETEAVDPESVAVVERGTEPTPEAPPVETTATPAELVKRVEVRAPAEEAPAVFVPPPPLLDRGWVVQGRVHDLAAGELVEARVTISGLSDFQWPEDLVASGDVGADGFFEVDVTRLVLSEGWVRTPLRALVVVVDHPHHQPWKEQVPAKDEHRVMAELEDLDGPIRWWVDIHLQTAGTIRGRVTFEDGSPAAEARVAAWRMASGIPAENLSDVTACDANGEFLLRVPVTGEYIVCAFQAGHRTASRRLDVERGRRVEEAEPYVLSDGETIEGRVLRLGQPVADVKVQFYLRPRGSRRYVFGGVGGRETLTWTNGAMEFMRGEATTDTDGRYRVEGLLPATYGAQADAVAGYRSYLGGHYPEEREVRAPAYGVDLVYPHAAVRYENEEELAPQDRGLLTILRDGEMLTSIEFQGRHGLPSFCGPPGVQLSVEIAFARKAIWRENVTLPAAGEELLRTVHLQPAPDPAVLELALAGEGLEEVASVALALYRSEGEEEAEFLSSAAEVQEGVARFEELPPGRYLAVLRVGRSFHQYRAYYQDLTLELDLGFGQTVRRAAEFSRGGRIGIFARNESGEPLAAKVEVRDAHGQKLDLTFEARDETGRYVGSWRLAIQAVNETFPNLAPGDYTVHLDLEGYVPQVLPVRVEPGATSALDVVLKRR